MPTTSRPSGQTVIGVRKLLCDGGVGDRGRLTHVCTAVRGDVRHTARTMNDRTGSLVSLTAIVYDVGSLHADSTV